MYSKGNGRRLSEEEITKRMDNSWKERRIDHFIAEYLISAIVP